MAVASVSMIVEETIVAATVNIFLPLPLKTWYHHPQHGAAFRAVADGVAEQFGKDETVTPKKRMGGAQQKNGSSAKRQKIDDVRIKSLADFAHFPATLEVCRQNVS